MKSKIFKIIFILSFIPYIYIIISILFGGYTLNGVELHGVEKIMRNVTLYLPYFIYSVPIIPVCLTYQMCYIFREKSKIMFICSFIPYLFALLLALGCAIFGISFLSDTLHYGFDGFVIGLIGAFSCYVLQFPVIPLCFIFQISYIIIRIKKRKRV